MATNIGGLGAYEATNSPHAPICVSGIDETGQLRDPGMHLELYVRELPEGGTELAGVLVFDGDDPTPIAAHGWLPADVLNEINGS